MDKTKNYKSGPNFNIGCTENNHVAPYARNNCKAYFVTTRIDPYLNIQTLSGLHLLFTRSSSESK